MTTRITMFVAGVVAAGCGSVKGSTPGQDAGVDASADAPPRACDPTKPFGPAVPVPGIDDPQANDVHASLTSDELTIYFGSNRGDRTADVMHIYTATRPSRDAAFTMPMFAPGTFSTEGESNPSISPDGNTIFFDSFRTMAGLIHIFTSTRLNAGVAFPTPRMIDGDFLLIPSITADGKVLYVEDIMHGTIARLDRTATGFGPPQQVVTPLTRSVTSPVSSDDLTLYLSLGEMIGDDIHVTTRATTNSPWPTPTPVTELKTTAAEAAASWVSADGCRIYVTYTPTRGTSSIHVATRPM